MNSASKLVEKTHYDNDERNKTGTKLEPVRRDTLIGLIKDTKPLNSDSSQDHHKERNEVLTPAAANGMARVPSPRTALPDKERKTTLH